MPSSILLLESTRAIANNTAALLIESRFSWLSLYNIKARMSLFLTIFYYLSIEFLIELAFINLYGVEYGPILD